MLTLFTTPVVYLYLDNFSNAISRWTTARKHHEAQAHAKRSIKDAAE
jgi:HAE1 family hydrophobic/amphiphilic exporter-1